MSYRNIAVMAKDGHLRERIAACAAKEGVTHIHPTQWADQHQWQLAAAPGWAEAYTYAVATEQERPGEDEAVITDGMILSEVQLILNEREDAE